MTEVVRGVSEIVGVDCLQARTAALEGFEALGPPDLCRLTKASRTPWAGSSTGSSAAASDSQQIGFFHYVIGLDFSGVAAAVDYIHGLMRAQEKGPWMSWLLGNSSWDITGGVYCCYDAFTRTDVRVEVPPPAKAGEASPAAPGSSTPTYCVGEGGECFALTRDVWEGAQLSAFLRAVQRPPRLPALRAVPMFMRPGALESFVRLATRNFAWGEKLEGGPPELQLGAHILCELFCGFLVASRRLSLALEVFPSLQGMYQPVVMHIARAYVKRGQPEAALNVLVRAARDMPNDGGLLHLQAKVLLAESTPGAAELAVAAAEHAVWLMPDVWRFWVTLAAAYLQLGQYGHCLAALNAPPLAAVGSDESGGQAPELGLPDFAGAERTVPPSGVRPGLVALRPYAFQLLPAQKGAVQFGGFGPGFGLNPGLDERRADAAAPDAAAGTAAVTPGGGGSGAAGAAATAVAAGAAATAAERELVRPLETCSGAQLTPVEQAAYKILVGVQRHLGWDELLKQRSKVFLMVGAGLDPLEGEYDDFDDGADAESSEIGSSYQGSAVASEEARQYHRSRRLPKRLCSKLIDRLFQALHADLTFFNDWRLEQEEFPFRPPHSSGAFWMQRGALAVRLQQHGQAELAFRLCQVRCACPKASLELLRIYSDGDRAVEAVAQLAVLCGIAAADVGRSEARPWSGGGGWPDWLFESAAKLICRFGVTAVHAAAGQLPESCMYTRFALAELLRAASDAEVDGVGR